MLAIHRVKGLPVDPAKDSVGGSYVPDVALPEAITKMVEILEQVSREQVGWPAVVFRCRALLALTSRLGDSQAERILVRYPDE